jgi:lipoyl(octanoyl) transferase
MWGYFGDALDGPPGTYYDSRSEPVTYFWNIFEQVLIRPTLLDAFVPASLKILDSDGDETLLTKLQHSFDRLDTVAEFRLLGRVPFEAAAALQERLVYEAGGLAEPRIVVLMCEHPDLITVGRAGSRGHVRFSNDQLKHEQLSLRWVGRGGGCVLHAPGQLAVYPIVPLNLLGWTVGEYLRRFQRGLVEGFAEVNVRGEMHDGSFGVWGRSGLLANVGVAVRGGITCHGAFINVNPAMRRYAFVDVFPPHSDPENGKSVMGCLLAERQAAVRMSGVRAALVKTLSAAFDCERYHLFTGHPWLSSAPANAWKSDACQT